MGTKCCLVVAISLLLTAIFCKRPGQPNKEQPEQAETPQSPHRDSATQRESEPAGRNEPNWIGEFDDAEKESLLSFLGRDEFGYRLYGRSRVIKDDLDGDSVAEYVLNVVDHREPRDGLHPEVLLVLRQSDQGYAVTVYSPNEIDPGNPDRRRIYTLDFDNDGLKDIVDQRAFHIGGEEPESYCLVLRNVGSGLTAVYDRSSYRNVAFKDLDRNGNLELIESTNEFKLTGVFWPVVYEWNGSAFVDSSYKFVEFYREKANELRKFRDKVKEWNAMYIERTGKPNETDEDTIRAMNVYLSRIEAMKEQK